MGMIWGGQRGLSEGWGLFLGSAGVISGLGGFFGLCRG